MARELRAAVCEPRTADKNFAARSGVGLRSACGFFGGGAVLGARPHAAGAGGDCGWSRTEIWATVWCWNEKAGRRVKRVGSVGRGRERAGRW